MHTKETVKCESEKRRARDPLQCSHRGAHLDARDPFQMGGCGSKAKPVADEEAGTVLPPAAPRSDAAPAAEPPAPPKTFQLNLFGPTKVATPEEREAKHAALKERVASRRMNGFARSVRGTTVAKPDSTPDSEAGAPALSSKGIVAIYATGLSVLAIAAILSLVQIGIDHEVGHKHWHETTCTIAKAVDKGKVDRAHGGLACALVTVIPLGNERDETIVVPVNADLREEKYPTLETLRWHQDELARTHAPGSTHPCWLSKGRHYAKLVGDEVPYRQSYRGCPHTNWDLGGIPYALVVFTVGLMYLLGFTSLDELRLAWQDGGYDEQAQKMAIAFGYVPPPASAKPKDGPAKPPPAALATAPTARSRQKTALTKQATVSFKSETTTATAAPPAEKEKGFFDRMTGTSAVAAAPETGDTVYDAKSLDKYKPPPPEPEDEGPSLFAQGSVRARPIPAL